jgi:hypothetical protein
MKFSEAQKRILNRAENQLEVLEMTIFDLRAKKPILSKEKQVEYINRAIKELKDAIGYFVRESKSQGAKK